MEWELKKYERETQILLADKQRETLLQSAEYQLILNNYPLKGGFTPTRELEFYKNDCRDGKPIPPLVITSPPVVQYDPAPRTAAPPQFNEISDRIEDELWSFLLDHYNLENSERPAKPMTGAWKTKAIRWDAAIEPLFYTYKTIPTLVLESTVSGDNFKLRVAWWDMRARTPVYPLKQISLLWQKIPNLSNFLSVLHRLCAGLIIDYYNEAVEMLQTARQELQAKTQELEAMMTKIYIDNGRYQLTNAELQATKVGLKNYIDDLLVSSVTAFAMTTPPEGWLECKGQKVSRTTYARLFQRIGTTFGEGDGSTTFNLPDLTGVFIRGWDAAGEHDPDRKFGSYQADQMQSHTHKDSGHSHSGSTSNDGSHYHSGKTDTDGSHRHSGKSDTDGSHTHKLNSTFSIIEGPGSTGFGSGTKERKTWENPTTNSAGSHYHILYIDSAGSHFHRLDINYAGSHSHTVSTNNSSASLGNPVSADSEDVRHGNETRTKNVALMFCIKY